MKKLIFSLILIFIMTSKSMAGSIFTPVEEVSVDKTQPFLINIYSTSDYATDVDFEEPVLINNRQIHFFNKDLGYLNQDDNDNFFISAKRSIGVDLYKNAVDSVEFKTNYKYGKWDLTGGFYQETVSGYNKYYDYISFEPVYRFNGRFAIFGEMAHTWTDNHDQTGIGIIYTPQKFDRLSIKLGILNYTRQFYNYRNRLRLETVFKI